MPAGRARGADAVLHVIQIAAIPFMVAVHIKHRQAGEHGVGPGNGAGVDIDVAGKNHHIRSRVRTSDRWRVRAPDLVMQVGKNQQAHWRPTEYGRSAERRGGKEGVRTGRSRWYV